MSDSPTDSSSATPSSEAPRHASAAKRIEKLLITLLKIAIAVAGICWVAYKTDWFDSGTLPEGTSINAVTLGESVKVRVVEQTPPNLQAGRGGGGLVRVRFPDSPVLVIINNTAYRLVIDENTPVPGGQGQLGLAKEKEVPLNYLSEEQGQRVHEGLRTLLLRAREKWYLVFFAWLMLGTPFFVTAIRWRNLMRPQGINMPLGKCLQLTFVGQFYSILLPGIKGGDLLKIVYAARLIGSKTKSFITVILDRVIGLVSLMAIAATSAGIQLLLNWHAGKPLDNTLFNVFVMIVLLLLALAAGATVYFSHTLRRIAGITWFIENFGHLSSSREGPTGQESQHQQLEHLFRVTNGVLLAGSLLLIGVMAFLRWGTAIAWVHHNAITVYIAMGVLALVALAAAAGLMLHTMVVNRVAPIMGRIVGMIIGVDETMHVYRGHIGLLFWAFLISIVSQLTLPLSAWLSGMAFGMTAPVTYYLAYVPIAVLAASLPISPPQGFGIMDYILYHFFVERGTARAGQAVALAQSVRFLPILWNLLGAYWVITGRYSRHQAEEEERELKNDMPQSDGAPHPTIQLAD
jgi:uncharacterized membrane protein YbhN (UPF0104 family)